MSTHRTTHITRDDEELAIAQMEDTHLVNMLRIYHRRIMELRRRAGVQTTTNRLDAALMRVQTMDPEDAAERIIEIMDDAAMYFVEAYLRGMDEPRKMLQEIYNRQGSIAMPVLPDLGSHLIVEGNHED